jgi:hypothetical protein
MINRFPSREADITLSSQEITAFYGIKIFIAVFTRARN